MSTEPTHHQTEATGQFAKRLRDAIEEDPGSAVSSRVPPISIPGYEILGELHRGGQGVVYRAIQQSTKRKVAIKVLLEGPFASEAAKKRFDREIELVASLKHPNIISVFDSGETPDGHRYCVMDYIRGVPLRQHVYDKKLPLANTLGLFAKVCDAVNYAHQKGVIHRDLKPSNILVDADGMPKVLDFGLAKMMAGPVENLVSVTGQIVGTLPYMSPEQAHGNPEEIDIRSDVYALGVILYEILTGHYPYPVVGQMVDVLRHISETPPTPPSRIRKAVPPSTQTGDQARVSQANFPIDNELETMILRSLKKERDRRYQSAGELARDITRYLAGEPIEAKRDHPFYILRKIAWRYRAAIAVGCVFLLVIGVALALGLKQRARLARQREELNQAETNDIMAAFVNDPTAATARTATASSAIRDGLSKRSEAFCRSPAYTERIMGVRSALMVRPQAFWSSVDAGPLWRHGEWLELCEMPHADPSPVLALLRQTATEGSARQKYVAFCVIGELAPKTPDLADLCGSAVRSETEPGVVSAARWAAMRLGKPVAPPNSERILTDEISGFTFVRLPICESFRRGSDPDDRDRYENEARPAVGVPIIPIFLASTEVTLKAIAPFVDDPANADLFGSASAAPATSADLAGLRDLAGKSIRAQLKSLSAEEASQTAVGWISLEAARRYCQWLTARAKQASSPRRYRLPTENEWEYACRGGNEGRFCFGDDERYLPHFANCGGYQQKQIVGQRMPNWYGLFDMHGGLWEWCDSPFPPELVKDPAVSPEAARSLYVIRGGAFYSPAVRCRSAQRNYCDLRAPNMYYGLRIVMEPAAP